MDAVAVQAEVTLYALRIPKSLAATSGILEGFCYALVCYSLNVACARSPCGRSTGGRHLRPPVDSLCGGESCARTVQC